MHKAIVLMYHRIVPNTPDVWDINVWPEIFESQLQLLQKKATVISVDNLVKDIRQYNLKKNCIAITFDDGYANNYSLAKPLLEKYNLPATFFVSSCNIGTENEFWWDELENVVLFTVTLPQVFKMNIAGELFEFDLADETYLTEKILHKNRYWKACNNEPPTLRADLFYSLWQRLKILPHLQQEEYMQQVRVWAGVQAGRRQYYTSMSVNELKDIAAHPLFTIGAHTATHPALAYHTLQVQKEELEKNKKFLEEVTGREVKLLAYPYGNYNDETQDSARAAGFVAAFTTEEKLIEKNSPRFSLGRYQVTNKTAADFDYSLKQWALS